MTSAPPRLVTPGTGSLLRDVCGALSSPTYRDRGPEVLQALEQAALALIGAATPAEAKAALGYVPAMDSPRLFSAVVQRLAGTDAGASVQFQPSQWKTEGEASAAFTSLLLASVRAGAGEAPISLYNLPVACIEAQEKGWAQLSAQISSCLIGTQCEGPWAPVAKALAASAMHPSRKAAIFPWLRAWASRVPPETLLRDINVFPDLAEAALLLAVAPHAADAFFAKRAAASMAYRDGDELAESYARAKPLAVGNPEALLAKNPKLRLREARAVLGNPHPHEARRQRKIAYQAQRGREAGPRGGDRQPR